MNDVAVSNVMTLNEDDIIYALQSCTTESLPSPMGAAKSNAAVKVIDEHVGELITSELVEGAASQAVTSPDVIATVPHTAVTT